MITLPIYFGIVVVSSAITFIMAIWLQNRQTQEIVTKIDVQERKRRPLGFKPVAFFFYSYAFNGQTMTNLRLIAVWKPSASWRALALHCSRFHCIIKLGWITNTFTSYLQPDSLVRFITAKRPNRYFAFTQNKLFTRFRLISTKRSSCLVDAERRQGRPLPSLPNNLLRKNYDSF